MKNLIQMNEEVCHCDKSLFLFYKKVPPIEQNSMFICRQKGQVLKMKADLILYSDAIFDSVKDEPFSGGIAIAGEKILAVGTREEMEAFCGEKTEVRDFGDKLIMPGFCEAHGHYIMGAQYFSEVACHDMEQCRSEQECADMVEAFAKEHPEQEVIVGKGWYLSYWGKDAKFPTKDSLDRAVPDRPVFLTSSDVHSLWMNTKAMEFVDLKERMKDYSEENVLRDENGEPTGVVREKGGDFSYEKEKTKAEIKKEQKDLAKEMNRFGFTAFSELSFIEPDALEETFQYIRELEEEDEWSLRLYIFPGTHFEADLLEDIKPYEKMFDSDKLKICGVKGILDGVTATYTAWMLEPYLDNPATAGVPAAPPEKLREWILKANALGYSARVHCIGDRAVREVLNIYEESNQVNDASGLRNAIEHIEIISPEDIPRFGELNVIASMQPRHQILDKAEKLIRCGKEKSRYEWPFRSILDGGAHLALGTDYPVVHFDPYLNIYFGMTKKDVDGTQYGTQSLGEVITLAEAIKGYTVEAAYVNSMEHVTGTLEPGKYADICVAGKNLFEIPVEEIKDCKNVFTVFNGKIVFDDTESKAL